MVDVLPVLRQMANTNSRVNEAMVQILKGYFGAHDKPDCYMMNKLYLLGAMEQNELQDITDLALKKLIPGHYSAYIKGKGSKRAEPITDKLPNTVRTHVNVNDRDMALCAGGFCFYLSCLFLYDSIYSDRGSNEKQIEAIAAVIFAVESGVLFSIANNSA
jgi:hypothetical protein